jgi:hypothetical protein
MARFTGVALFAFAVDETNTGCPLFRAFAHLAFCARAILRLEAADMTRVGADVTPVGRLVIPDTPEPFNDSITEIA